MTTAREQAREAVFDAFQELYGIVLAEEVGAAVDAASDVWEPIVRDLVQDLERAMTYFDGIRNPRMHSTPLARAKGALG